MPFHFISGLMLIKVWIHSVDAFRISVQKDLDQNMSLNKIALNIRKNIIRAKIKFGIKSMILVMTQANLYEPRHHPQHKMMNGKNTHFCDEHNIDWYFILGETFYVCCFQWNVEPGGQPVLQLLLCSCLCKQVIIWYNWLIHLKLVNISNKKTCAWTAIIAIWLDSTITRVTCNMTSQCLVKSKLHLRCTHLP